MKRKELTMKGLKNSRPFAAFCLAVVILLSVLLGGLRSVKKLEKRAYNAYYTEYEDYGKADEDIRKLNRYAAMLYSLCLSCNCAEEEFALTVDSFDKKAGDPYLSAELYHSLFNLSSLAYNMLINSPYASDQQKTSAKQYFYEMESTMRRLSNNGGYNDAAKKYNRALQSFPMSLVMKNADLMIVFD